MIECEWPVLDALALLVRYGSKQTSSTLYKFHREGRLKVKGEGEAPGYTVIGDDDSETEIVIVCSGIEELAQRLAKEASATRSMDSEAPRYLSALMVLSHEAFHARSAFSQYVDVVERVLREKFKDVDTTSWPPNVTLRKIATKIVNVIHDVYANVVAFSDLSSVIMKVAPESYIKLVYALMKFMRKNVVTINNLDKFIKSLGKFDSSFRIETVIKILNDPQRTTPESVLDASVYVAQHLETPNFRNIEQEPNDVRERREVERGNSGPGEVRKLSGKSDARSAAKRMREAFNRMAKEMKVDTKKALGAGLRIAISKINWIKTDGSNLTMIDLGTALYTTLGEGSDEDYTLRKLSRREHVLSEVWKDSDRVPKAWTLEKRGSKTFVAMIDFSASISDKTKLEFLKDVMDLASREEASVVVVPWTCERNAHEVMKNIKFIERVDDPDAEAKKIIEEVSISGGTYPLGAFRAVKEIVEGDDIETPVVVLLTDGIWRVDEKLERAYSDLKDSVLVKGGKLYLFTTSVVPSIMTDDPDVEKYRKLSNGLWKPT